MEIKHTIFISIFLFSAVVGNYFFKQGALSLAPLTFSAASVLSAITSPSVILGVIFYGFAAIFWFVVLSMIPLNVATSISVLIYIFIILLSYFVFHEEIPLSRWGGILFIAIGLVLMGRTT